MEKILSDTSSIDDLKSWALKLGCPVNALPSDAALCRFIKSNYACVQKLMKQMGPKSEVKLIKSNLLSYGVSNSNLTDRYQSDSIVLNNIRKVDKLNRHISQLRSKIEQLKSEWNEKQSSLMHKGLFDSLIYDSVIVPNVQKLNSRI